MTDKTDRINGATVGEIRALIAGLPDDMPIEFAPITDAWLGTSNPMRWGRLYFYSHRGDAVPPYFPRAHCEVHLFEEREEDSRGTSDAETST